MAQREGGWPLGLQPWNQEFSGSLSFNTVTTTASPSSSVTSSDLDTESATSFFHERSMTLGSLIGITSILKLSNRSHRSRRQCTSKQKKYKPKACFSFCSRARLADSETPGNVPTSLGHFLRLERKASNVNAQKNQTSIIYEIEGISESRFDPEPNSLFSNDIIVPPEDVKKSNRLASYDVGRFRP